MASRAGEIVQRYPELLVNERETRLPVWAQAKLSDLRRLLLQEAEENDLLREEIERLT